MRPIIVRLALAASVCITTLSSVALAQPAGKTPAVDPRPDSVSARQKWIDAYGLKSLQARFYRITRGDSDADVLPIKFGVTAAERDGDENQDDLFPGFITSRAIWYGVEIADDWRLHHFYHSSRGTKGGGGSAIPESDRKRLTELIAKLPPDATVLPPPNRRVLVQVAQADRYECHIYDRANAPAEILDLLRRSGSGIRSFVVENKPQTVWQAHHHGEALFAVCPDGETLIIGAPGFPGRFTFWNSATQQSIREDNYWPMAGARAVEFSPDNKFAAFFDGYEVTVLEVTAAEKWKIVANHDESRAAPGSRWRTAPRPAFTPDGKFLVMPARSPAIRVLDTATWKAVAPPAYFPPNASAYFPTRDGSRAVVAIEQGKVALWDAGQRRQYATLEENADIRHVAFSTEGSLVAVIATRERSIRLGVWNVATGALVHDLYPLEQDIHHVSHLLWASDDKYLLAASKPDGFFTSMNISVWNVKTGRHRGDLTGPMTSVMGIGWLKAGKQLVAACQEGKVRIWDFETARKEIENFERSLEEPLANMKP